MNLSTGELAAADRARARAESQVDDVYTDALDLLGQRYDPTIVHVILCRRVAEQLDVDPEVDRAAATAIAMLAAAVVWDAQYRDEPPAQIILED
jgi:hypothetical protein